ADRRHRQMFIREIESARGSHQWVTRGIFKSCGVSPPLICASDFVMLVRGPEPIEKLLRRGILASLLSFFLEDARKFPRGQ
ncbi:hypothetical protein ACVGWV_07900, partial [Enterobacter asburiae]